MRKNIFHVLSCVMICTIFFIITCHNTPNPDPPDPPDYVGTWVNFETPFFTIRETLSLDEDSFEYMRAVDRGSGFVDHDGCRGRGIVVILVGDYEASINFLDEIYLESTGQWHSKGELEYEGRVNFPVLPQIITVSDNTLKINWGNGQKVFVKQ